MDQMDIIIKKWSEESKSQMDGMGHISENDQKCQHVRWIEWVRLDKRVKRVQVSDGLEGSH